MYICIYVYMKKCKYVHVHIYIYTYTYIHLHIYTNSYICIHTMEMGISWKHTQMGTYIMGMGKPL